ncbi:glycoside hydrolase family 13 protein [Georgenia sp. TF02-10]|uniref:glycoside hydrolase family 13 protein n=1 Tax=Georgenia sp. TF02-10 TaxID=2917725 RepID=UPI001FA7E688|nr:alpha-amylase family glycosyl hydrolase [Georgenia sp. TF02-10]UNX53523.1 glycoside hydrolase family 13 protein [Georgenia sp. TF02-10]
MPHATTELITAAPDADAADRWWRHAVIYQVYPRSFADSDGDGMGDLPGITARLDHLAALGVDALWLSPFYRSPQADGGYDVADYRDVDPRFGTLADVDALLARAHELGLRVIVDLVPNHTSDEHAWFRAALAAGPGSPERDRYIFREGQGETGEEPPNNWQSVFGSGAWTRVRDRADAPGSPWAEDGQWYLHMFDTKQPDLNWDNPEVRAELISVLRFWLDRGVDGFRVDVAHGLVKAPGLPDWSGEVEMVEGAEEPAGVTADGSPGHARPPMFDQDGVHEIYRDWRRVLAEYDGDRILVAEAWVAPIERLARYVRPDEMHQAFNFAFLIAHWSAEELRGCITRSYRANDAVGAPTTWVLSNHDVVRPASRLGLPVTGKGPNGIGAEDVQPDRALGLRRARAASLLMLALPGSAYLYQGEELGLPEHTALPDAVRQDPAFARTGGAEKGRDGCRVPLPWAATEPGYGFSPTGATWLPQPADWAGYAVDAQTGRAGSTLELYRSALARRRELGLGAGTLSWLPEHRTDDVVALVNAPAGGPERPDVLVLANLGEQPVALPAGARLLLASEALQEDGDGWLVPADTTAWAVVDR